MPQRLKGVAASSDEPYPVAMLLCTVGFMCTLILEELGHYLIHDGSGGGTGHAAAGGRLW